MKSTDLPNLDTFCLAAELGSFTAAARKLNLTQAAVSQRIQALEKALGVSLFLREGGVVFVTEAGHRLHDYAQRILALHQEARQEITGRKALVAGELTIEASSVPGEHLLPAILTSFHRRYPGIQVRVNVSDSLEVMDRVERGKVQLGLVGRKSDNPHLEFRPFATDRMVLVVPARHAWRKRSAGTLQQLCSQPLILREAGSGLRHCFEKAIGTLGKSVRDLQVVLELGSNEAIKEAVLEGLGVAILSTYAVHKEVKSGKLHGLQVTDLHCDREMYTVWDRRRVQSAAARTFLIFLETHPVNAS